MKIEECINDPQFRKAFVEYEISSLDAVLKGNGNIIYHNEGKISILEQIKKELTLNNEEEDIINEHLIAINSLNEDINKQSKRLKIMSDIYKQFIKKNKKGETFKLI